MNEVTKNQEKQEVHIPTYAEWARQAENSSIENAIAAIQAGSNAGNDDPATLSYLESHKFLLTPSELAAIRDNVPAEKLATFSDLYEDVRRFAAKEVEDAPQELPEISFAPRVGSAFPIDNDVDGKRVFNVSLDIDKLNSLTPLTEEYADKQTGEVKRYTGNVALEVRAFVTKADKKAFYTVSALNDGLKEDFVVATIKVNRGDVIRHGNKSENGRYVSVKISPTQQPGKVAVWTTNKANDVQKAWNVAANIVADNDVKAIEKKFREVLKEQNIDFVKGVGYGVMGQNFYFQQHKIPEEIFNVTLDRNQRIQLHFGREVPMKNLTAKDGTKFAANLKWDAKAGRINIGRYDPQLAQKIEDKRAEREKQVSPTVELARPKQQKPRCLLV